MPGNNVLLAYINTKHLEFARGRCESSAALSAFWIRAGTLTSTLTIAVLLDRFSLGATRL